jgi:hypothetical protein
LRIIVAEISAGRNRRLRRGVGEGVETIDTIAAPLEFRNHITAR